MIRSPLQQIAFCIFCISISAYALSEFVQIIQKYLAVNYDFKMEIIAVTGQVGFQWLFMQSCIWAARLQYMLLALTVSMIGSVLLLPLIFYNWLATVSSSFAIGYFACVVLSIFIIHHCLIRQNKFPARLSLTWILYRVLLMAFLLYPRG